MTRPIILDGNPFVSGSFRKDSKTLLADTGGNTGNLAFRFAVHEQIRNARQMSLGSGVNAIRDAGDVIVLPLANQLGKHTDLGNQARLLEELGLPVVGLGLGAQADRLGDDVELTEGTSRWLDTMGRLAPSDAPNLGVRGAYTKDQIGRLGSEGRATVTGCPSNFINTVDDIASSVADRMKRKGGRIAVTAGIPHIARLAPLERQLADIVTLTDGAYIVQHGLEMVQIARREFDRMDPSVFALTHQYVQPDLSADEFKAWCDRYAFALFDIRYWMDFVQRFDFVVGTRFHGVMIAIQAGVPAGCIAHDSRTYEMCCTMGIPVRLASELPSAVTRHNVRDLFAFDADDYRHKRELLAKQYVLIADAAGLELAAGLRGLAQA